jgi:hypothetical protein
MMTKPASLHIPVPAVIVSLAPLKSAAAKIRKNLVYPPRACIDIDYSLGMQEKNNRHTKFVHRF